MYSQPLASPDGTGQITCQFDRTDHMLTTLTATWGSDDTIVFATGPGSGLSRVPVVGGRPQVLTVPDPKKGESAHVWPHFLPGGQAVPFTIRTGPEYADARIGVLNLRTGEQ